MGSHFILSLSWQRLNTVSWIKASTALPCILLHGMLYSDKRFKLQFMCTICIIIIYNCIAFYMYFHQQMYTTLISGSSLSVDVTIKCGQLYKANCKIYELN